MGKIPQGIFGGISGKIGGLVGSSWKGIAYLRQMAMSVHQPDSPAQLKQRTKFTNVVDVAVQLLAVIIKPLWDRFAVKMSGYNNFVHYNIDLFEDVFPDPPEGFEISHGSMGATQFDTVTAVDNEAGIECAWIDDSGSGYKLATDLAFFVAYNLTQGIWAFGEASDGRSVPEATITFPAKCVLNDELYCYLAFKRADGTIVSMTAYKNVIVAAA